MIVIVCLDDNNGMAFNKRRQSRDEKVVKDILENTDKKIWVNQYSSKLFEPFEPSKLIVEENFFDCLKSGDYCFVESNSIKSHEDKIEYIIIYHWNRIYPADVYFDIDLSSDQWELLDTKEFKGVSHDTITREIYKHKV